MKRLLGLAVALAGLASLVVFLLAADPPARSPRKVALLVGPSTYLHDFENLQYAHLDALALAEKLRAGGFDEVVVLTDPPEGKNPATGQNILVQLERLLNGNADPAKNIRRGDVVLIGLSGHGLEIDVDDPDKPGEKRRDVFFAPTNGKKREPKTLVNLNTLMAKVASCGRHNLLLVDACRELYDPNKGKGFGNANVQVAKNTSVLFSCASTEQSWENAAVKHGVFTAAVLEVLTEAAREEEFLWDELVAGVKKKMRTKKFRDLVKQGYEQTCELSAGRVPAVALLDPRAGGERPLSLDCTGKDGVSAAGVKKAQAAWANYLGREVVKEHEIALGVKIRFVLVPPGKFRMGSPSDETDREKDETEHEVTLKEPFYLGQYEVTQAQYMALTGDTPSKFKGYDLPVEQVDWTQSKAFAEKVSVRLKAGHLCRLPTEAEWEYACRGGRPFSQPFGIGDGISFDSNQANFDGNHPYGKAAKGVGVYREKTTPVGSFSANAFGLYDMHGNVWEWCGDWYREYPSGGVSNPSGPSEGSYRVIRGGSWGDDVRFCRSANRDWIGPSFRLDYLGFRLALVPPSGR